MGTERPSSERLGVGRAAMDLAVGSSLSGHRHPEVLGRGVWERCGPVAASDPELAHSYRPGEGGVMTPRDWWLLVSAFAWCLPVRSVGL